MLYENGLEQACHNRLPRVYAEINVNIKQNRGYGAIIFQEIYMKLEIELTTKEAKVLNELCAKTDLDKQHIMIQALRLYQMFCLGHVKVDESHLPRKLM